MKKSLLLTISISLIAIVIASGQGTWVPQSSGTSAYLTSVYFVSSDTGYVSTGSGYIYKTNNGGQNWNYMGPGPWSSLAFLNAQKGFGAGEECILKTLNGGTTWDTCFKNPAVYGIMGIYFPDKTHGYAAAMSGFLDGFIIKTDNGGLSWDTIYQRMNNFFTSVFFTDSLHGYLGTSDGYIVKTTNGGNNWQIIPTDGSGNVMINSVFFTSQDTGFAVTDIDGVYKTTDAGLTWNTILYSFPPALYSIFFTDADHGYTVGGNGINSMTLYQTNDGGDNWYQGASGVQTLNCVFFTDTITGYAVGDNGTILKHVYITGAEENKPANDAVEIFPSPATDKITITIPEEFTGQKTLCSIYSVQGKLIQQQNLDGMKTELDISWLSPGIYLVKIGDGENTIVKRLVKQ
jgi:photosystem II stability/assembly factor-like uncharacterized protein